MGLFLYSCGSWDKMGEGKPHVLEQGTPTSHVTQTIHHQALVYERISDHAMHSPLRTVTCILLLIAVANCRREGLLRVQMATPPQAPLAA